MNTILVLHSSPLHHITPPITRSLLSWSLQGESSHKDGRKSNGVPALGHKHILYVEQSANHKVVEYRVHELLK